MAALLATIPPVTNTGGGNAGTNRQAGVGQAPETPRQATGTEELASMGLRIPTIAKWGVGVLLFILVIGVVGALFLAGSGGKRTSNTSANQPIIVTFNDRFEKVTILVNEGQEVNVAVPQGHCVSFPSENFEVKESTSTYFVIVAKVKTAATFVPHTAQSAICRSPTI